MFVTLNEMKTRLGIELADTTYDDFLTAQIQLYSSTIQNYCGRVFPSAAYIQTVYEEDYYSEYKSTGLLLYHFPLISVTSVVEDGTPLTADEYRVHKPSGKIFKLYDGRKSNWCGKLVFTFTSGYADIPLELKEVVYNLVEADYNKNSNGIALNFGREVQSVAVPGVMNLAMDFSLQTNERESTFGMLLTGYTNVCDFFRSERAVIGSVQEAYVE